MQTDRQTERDAERNGWLGDKGEQAENAQEQQQKLLKSHAKREKSPDKNSLRSQST